jgi:hypothetical protein
MKYSKLALLALASVTFVSCAPDPVYVPVYVPVEGKKPAKKVTYYKPKPKVESAEGFRAVEKPTTYSY